VIVLIHGYLETSEIWASFARKLAETFRLFQLIFPDTAGSAIFTAMFILSNSWQQLSKILLRIPDGKDLPCGHSMGGYFTLAFADLSLIS